MKYFSSLLLFGLLAATALLVGCGQTDNQNASNQLTAINEDGATTEYSGEKGTTVKLENGQVVIDSDQLTGTTANFYNTELPSGQTIYFFVVKDKNGVYRAAANACQVCADSKMGFRQEGDQMVCNTCGNGYSLEKIATEKGGCNPAPINPDLEVTDGQIIITQTDLEQITEYF